MSLDYALDELRTILESGAGDSSSVFFQIGTYLREETNRANEALRGLVSDIMEYTILKREMAPLGDIYRLLANFVADSVPNKHLVLHQATSEQFFAFTRDRIDGSNHSFFILHFLNNLLLDCPEASKYLNANGIDLKVAYQDIPESWQDVWTSVLEELATQSTSCEYFRALMKIDKRDLMYEMSKNDIDLQNDTQLMHDLIQRVAEDDDRRLFDSVMNISANPSNANNDLEEYLKLIDTEKMALQALGMIIMGNYIMSPEQQAEVAANIKSIEKLVDILISFAESCKVEYLQAVYLLNKLLGNRDFRERFPKSSFLKMLFLIDSLFEYRLHETEYKNVLKLNLNFHWRYSSTLSEDEAERLEEHIVRWKSYNSRDDDINCELQKIMFKIIEHRNDATLANLAFDGFATNHKFERQLDLVHLLEKVKSLGILVSRDSSITQLPWFPATMEEFKAAIDTLHQQPSFETDPRLQLLDNNYRYICAKVGECK
ncbi:hypothetical protein KL910_004125 [Ogataea haglerorum]|nr:hypothetical protein KL910_004125 [Ogataea haglerorum]KAG7787535.1 hypothetical protein KL945_002684 [Ogataea haglerorum]